MEWERDKWPEWPKLGQTAAESLELWICHLGQGTKDSSHLPCVLRLIGSKLDQKQGSQNSCQWFHECWCHRRQPNPLCQNTNSYLCIFVISLFIIQMSIVHIPGFFFFFFLFLSKVSFRSQICQVEKRQLVHCLGSVILWEQKTSCCVQCWVFQRIVSKALVALPPSLFPLSYTLTRVRAHVYSHIRTLDITDVWEGTLILKCIWVYSHWVPGNCPAWGHQLLTLGTSLWPLVQPGLIFTLSPCQPLGEEVELDIWSIHWTCPEADI